MYKVRTISDFVPLSLEGTEAGALIVKATAHLRHKDRVEATLEAARDAATMCPEYTPKSVEALGLFADLIGDGNKTERIPSFRHLGKGRRQASDGAAYMAALKEALNSYNVEFAIVKNDQDDIYFVIIPREISFRLLKYGEDTIPCERFIELDTEDSSLGSLGEQQLIDILGPYWAECMVRGIIHAHLSVEYASNLGFVRHTNLDTVGAFYNLVKKECDIALLLERLNKDDHPEAEEFFFAKILTDEKGEIWECSLGKFRRNLRKNDLENDLFLWEEII